MTDLTPERELILRIVAERHPDPAPIPEIKARYLDLIREYGSVERAVAFMRQKARRLQ
jgi:hypothetical protein